MLLPLLLLLACQPPAPPAAPSEPAPADAVVEPAAEDAAEPVTAAASEENRAPVILSIQLDPARPTARQDLTAIVEAEDPDRDRVRLRLFWTVDGEELRGQNDRRLPHANFERGDTLRLRVEASDGHLTTEGLSSPIVVANTAPEIVNKPGTLRKVEGYTIKADDDDDDPLTYRLEGAPPGMTIDGDGVLHYQGDPAARGGKYQVQVVVEDGQGGRARWSFDLAVEAGSGGAAEEAAEAEAAAAAARPARRSAREPEQPAEPTEDAEGLLPDDGRAAR